MNLSSLRYSLAKKALSIPVNCRHKELSALLSADDEASHPDDYLFDISLKAISNARKSDLHDLSERMPSPPFYSDVWPGEHYRLLAGFVMALKPRLVVEIGTFEGLSALALKKYMPEGGKLVTFDIVPWDKMRTQLKESDFSEDFIQYTDDLSRYEDALKHKSLLNNADLIFVDAAKDGKMEFRFMENFEKVGLKEGALVLFDDIRVWNMLRFWREIKYPKLDLTSFGHWSGTGVIHWKKPKLSS